jgi:hypothetical protein
MTELDDSAVDQLHEEIYGKPNDAPVSPYVDDDDPGDDAPATPPGDTPPAADDFKHKYDVLQGKYNAEMGRMNKMLSDAMLEKERLAAQSVTPPAAAPFSDDVMIGGDEDIEFLRSQYPDAYRGIEALVKKTSSELLKPVADNMAKTAADIRTERYLKDLDDRLPDWRKINDDPIFVDWLNRPDRYTGATKFQLIRDAFSKGDSTRTLAFFEDFLSDVNRAAPPPPAPPRPADTDIYPNSSPNPAAPTGEKGIVYKADIDRFYKDRATGRFLGSEEDAAKIESRFFRAVKEGKVR